MPWSALPLLLAAVSALLAGAFCYWAIGIVARRRRETQLGIRALAALKWRELSAALLAALRQRGYAVEQAQAAEEGDGYEFMLVRDGRRHLVSCKHGTRYRLGTDFVREFATTMDMHAACSGTIATPGDIEAAAHPPAGAASIRLLDGAALWREVRPFLPEATRHAIRTQARRDSGRGLVLAGTACLALGGLVYAALDRLLPEPAAAPPPPATIRATPPPEATADPSPPRADPGPAPVPPDAGDEPARRAALLRAVSALPGVDAAAWASQSTLVLHLPDGDAAAEARTIASVCGLVGEVTGLDLTRLQLQPPPGSDRAVRWRRCA